MTQTLYAAYDTYYQNFAVVPGTREPFLSADPEAVRRFVRGAVSPYFVIAVVA